MVNHRVRYQSPNMYPTSHSNRVYELSAVHGCHEVAKPHNWSTDSCHCKNKIVTLAFGYYSCMTVITMRILWMQCWKLKTHAVVTDTSLPQNVLQPPRCLNYHRKDSHAVANNLLNSNFVFTVAQKAEFWYPFSSTVNCPIKYTSLAVASYSYSTNRSWDWTSHSLQFRSLPLVLLIYFT